MKTVRGFLILIACFNLGIETAGQMLFTPPMAFEDNNFPRCISALSDSALVWEEQSFWERYEGPGPIRVEICESFTVSRTSFYHDEGEEDALRWTATWVNWLEQMRDAGVEEVKDILESWRQQGQPYLFDYCTPSEEVGDGGHCLHAEPGQLVIEFYVTLW